MPDSAHLVPESGYQFVIRSVKQQLPGPQCGERCPPLPVLVLGAGKHGLCCEPGLEGKSLPLQSSLLPKVYSLCVTVEGLEENRLCNYTDGQDQEALHSRVSSFNSDVHHECLWLAPDWPPVRAGASDRQGPGVSSCKLQLQPSDVLGASRQP